MATPDQREANKRAAQQIIDVWDGDDLDVLNDVVAEDVVADIAFPEQVRGREAYKEALHTFRSAFPDLTSEANGVVAEDDTVVVHYTARGTHEGELMGIEPTGASVEASGFVLYRFDDGTVVEVTNIGDLFGLMQQLGVVEPPTEGMATPEPSLQQRLEDVGSVLASGDAERIGDLYTREGQLMPPGSEFVTGRDAVAEFWQGLGETGVETIDIEPVEVEVHERTARRVGRATLADANGAAIDEVKFIEIWKQEDGEWRIHRDIWNSNVSDEQ